MNAEEYAMMMEIVDDYCVDCKGYEFIKYGAYCYENCEGFQNYFIDLKAKAEQEKP